jgi:hypothetical protein
MTTRDHHPVHVHNPADILSWEFHIDGHTFALYATTELEAIGHANAVVDATIGWPRDFGIWVTLPDRTVHALPTRVERAIDTVIAEIPDASVDDQLDAVFGIVDYDQVPEAVVRTHLEDQR